MQRCYFISKNDFARLFKLMSDFGQVHAPVRVSEESFAFKPVDNPEQIACQATRTILPPKKLFFPPQERVLAYRNGEFKAEHDLKSQVLFGVHPCDLTALSIIEKTFLDDPPDGQYVQRRSATLIVGHSCLPDKHCFCNSMGSGAPSAGFDLFLTTLEGEESFIQVGSDKGLKFVQSGLDFIKPAEDRHREGWKQFWIKREEKFSSCFRGENLPSLMDLERDSEIWKEYGQRCLSCGNCSMVCPTCYCFDMVDNMCLDGAGGHRCREWDSCQFFGFARVAGEFNFRATSVDRYKFWFRHKLHGFEDASGSKGCVGCGRCWVSCPADIDNIPEIVEKLQGQGIRKE